MASNWSIDIQKFFCYTEADINLSANAKNTKHANMALIKAAPNSGKDKYVKIKYNKLEYTSEDNQQIQKMLEDAPESAKAPEFVGNISIAGASFSIPDCEFEFQKVTYQCHGRRKGSKNSKNESDAPQFKQRHFPTHQTMQQYINHSGYSTFGEVCAAKRIFGSNEFDIPLPSFMELYVVSDC